VAGNVWEWCSTKYAPYPYDPHDGRENPPATYDECCRVMRGASWYDHTYDVRCADRADSDIPTRRNFSYGFRCARTE